MENTVEEKYRPKTILSMHPKRFVLWLFIVSIIMVFAALTSAYLVRRTEGDWLNFELPSLFMITSVIIVLSSVTMQMAFRASRRDEIEAVKRWLWITGILGIVFLAGQLIAWDRLVEENVYFVGNPAGSFVYVFSGLHGTHIIAGLIFLTIVLVKSYLGKVHSKDNLSIRLLNTFWHFLDGLWLYLYLFLELNR